MRRLKLKVYGDVQGVFFRASAAEKANELGLVGWVRNCSDGQCVETQAEGEEEILKQYYDWCKKGPSHADVEKVEEEWEEAKGDYIKFEIRY